ncbi:hypothetical protein ABZ403_14000 [Micromonospora zamorensis]|uniref:hypothetical protein n=1 Tax=Micromonospora zamorensis TaxID=709883 RepID=UPI003409F2D6
MTTLELPNGRADLQGLRAQMKAAYPDANLSVIPDREGGWLLIGACRLPEYRVWAGAKSRCNNPNTPVYGAYGGRGIKMDPEWEKDFLAFWRELGPRPAGTSLDRIDNDRGYEPGNVRWATLEEQANNKRGPKPRHERLAAELRAAGWMVTPPLSRAKELEAALDNGEVAA